jgi:Flp pilus assembly protein TadD
VCPFVPDQSDQSGITERKNMNKRSIRFSLMLFSLFCILAVAGTAQTAKHTSPARQTAASAEARNQLAAYVADFQRHPEDSALRQKIVELAKSINPEPPVSALARDSFTQATARLRTASTAEDFKAAGRLFERAAVQAPWYAEADANAATAFARGGDFEGARSNLNLYQEALRPGVDANAAEQLRREIDSQQAAQQFQAALRQFAAHPSYAAHVQIIQLVQAMKTPPEIPEEARGHYVMASVLAGSAEDNPTYAKRAIDEYNAALLAAPWWGEVYKKLAKVETTLGQFDEAIANLSYYLLIQPSDARKTQDEIYRLKALGQKAVDDNAQRQAEDQQREIQIQQKPSAAVADSSLTIEGRWYPIPETSSYFAGGQSNPECDYEIKQNGRRWTIANSCAHHAWTIENVDVQARNISFRILGRDAAFPFGEVTVTLSLSNDGQELAGQANLYDKAFNTVGSHPARWARR